jgi:hypothetical protein
MADTEDSRERKRAVKRAWYLANREKSLARAAQWKQDNKDRDNERRRANYAADPARVRDEVYAWRDANPERFAYEKRRQDAKTRGIPFLLTFEEWWSVWDESGKFAERGQHTGQYVMARHGDLGPYAVGNVRIITCNENVSEQHQFRPKRGPYKKRGHG